MPPIDPRLVNETGNSRADPGLFEGGGGDQGHRKGRYVGIF